MNKSVIAGSVAMLGFTILTLAAYADGVVPTKSYSKRLSLTADSTVTLEDALTAAGASVQDLVGNVYDCIEKTGAGSLQMNVSLSGFTGDIYVKSGRLDVSAASALGSATTVEGGETNGFVVVESGATVAWTGSAKLSDADKTVFITGSGDDGNGALQASTGAYQQKSVFGKCMILTGDASAYVSGANNQDMREDKTIVLNGFKLTISTDNRRFLAFRPRAIGPGKIELGPGTFALNDDLEFTGDADDELILNGAMLQYGASLLDSLPWTLVVAAPTTLNIRKTMTSEWTCPIRLDDMLLLMVSEMENPRINLSGSVSGTGSIFVKGSNGMKVALSGSGNSFSGGLGVEDATLEVVDGALPVSGGAAHFTNSVLSVISGGNVCFPACGFAGVCRVENADTADFASLEVDSGAFLSFDKITALVAPGLWYGSDSSVSWGTGKLLGGTYTPSLAYSNEVVTSFHKTVSGATIADADKGCLYTYSGYIINTDTVERVWSFSGAVRYRSRLLINGDVVFSQTGSQRYAGQATLRPGANPFLFQATSQDTRTGIISRGKTGTVTFGGETVTETDSTFYGGGIRSFVIDRQGRDPLSEAMMNAANWEVPEDPGDGSLFAIAVTRAEHEAQGLSVPTITAASATFGAGSTIDIGGRNFSVANLTGAPTVSNAAGAVDGNSFSVTGRWTLDDAALAAASPLESDCAISFGPASAFAVMPDGSDTAYGKILSAAHSDVAISGLPSCVADDDGRMRWSASVAEDGKTLSLTYIPKPFAIVIR